MALDAVAQFGGLLEPHHLRIEGHLLPQPSQQFRLVFDVADRLVDNGAVGVGGDGLFTGGETLLQLVVEAGPARFEAPFLLHEGAELVDRVEDVPRPDGVGAEVADVLPLDHLAGDLEAGVGLVEVDVDVGVGLVVAQQDVVLRLELLDQGVLQDQRIVFALDEDRVQRCRLPQHLADARGEVRVGGEAGGEAPVALYPVGEVLRLADIEQAPPGIEILVDAGAFWERPNLLEHG